MGEIMDMHYDIAMVANAAKADAIKQSKDYIDNKLRKTNALVHEIKFPKKAPKKKEAPKQRIVICGTTSWSKVNVIRKVIKDLDPKTIECVIVGTSRGAEQLALSICKGLNAFTVYQVHSLVDKYISYTDVIRMFKPNLVVAFNENPSANMITEGYQKLARRKDIEFKLVSK